MDVGNLEQDHLHDNTLLQHMKGFLHLIITTISTCIFLLVLNTVICISASGIIDKTYNNKRTMALYFSPNHAHACI